MYEGMMAQHPDYVGMGVVSAFDIALWDIVGKHFNTPVYNLLGGNVVNAFVHTPMYMTTMVLAEQWVPGRVT